MIFWVCLGDWNIYYTSELILLQFFPPLQMHQFWDIHEISFLASLWFQWYKSPFFKELEFIMSYECRCPINYKLSEDETNILMVALRFHPGRDEKIGTGVQEIKVFKSTLVQCRCCFQFFIFIYLFLDSVLWDAMFFLANLKAVIEREILNCNFTWSLGLQMPRSLANEIWLQNSKWISSWDLDAEMLSSSEQILWIYKS